MTVRIVQLYPDELGVAGDRGNVMALEARLLRAGLEAECISFRVGDDLPDAPDVIVIGGGPLSAMRVVHSDLLRIAERLRELANSGVPIFAYGSGAELFSTEVVLLEGGTMAGAGVFPFRAVRTRARNVGYLVIDTALGRAVGFEDNASRWDLEPGATPFGQVIAGGGNGDGATEGVRVGASIATQLGGPALPLNPAITESLIAAIIQRRGLDYEVGDDHAVLDHYAKKARGVIIDNAKHVFKRI